MIIAKYTDLITEDFQQQVLGIAELAEMASRTGYDEHILLDILQDAFKKGGDREVIKMFREMTDLDLEVIRHGKYVISY